MTINLVTGSVSRGADYFGRAELIDQLWTRLESDNLLLVAPRRYGKTGAMFQLLDAPRAPFQPLYIDVEHLESPADFMIELLAVLRHDNHFAQVVNALWEETKEFGRFLRGLASRIDLGSLKVHLREETDVATNWLSYGDRVMQSLARQCPNLLLLLDEFPILVHQMAQRNAGQLRQFLRWFRSARIAPATNVRFLVGGSINLVSTLDGVGLVDTVNDFAIHRLEPFDALTAKRFIQRTMQSRGIKLAPKVRQAVLAAIGTPIPYLLSLLLTALLDRHRTSGTSITAKMVHEVFSTDLLGGATPFFRHYYSRLREYYPGHEARLAKAILGLLSRSDTPVRRDTLFQVYLENANRPADADSTEEFQRLMQKLENDFYIAAEDAGYAFSNRAIRLWWKNNYGFQTG